MDIPQSALRYYHGNVEALKGRKDPEAIKTLAKEMEALFAFEMIKAMRETTGGDKKDLGGDTYMSIFDMQLARLFAERGIGLQDMLLKGMNRLVDKAKPEGKDDKIASDDGLEPKLKKFSKISDKERKLYEEVP